MVDYTSAISQIKNATSLEQISQIAEQFSAQASGPGGILYSGNVGVANADAVASQLAGGQGLNILDATARGQFLSDSGVGAAIKSAAQAIFESQGQSPAAAAQSVIGFLNGNPAVTEGPTSVASSLWGQASTEFATSLSGDITIVSSSANPLRMLAQLEIPALLNNPNITSIPAH